MPSPAPECFFPGGGSMVLRQLGQVARLRDDATEGRLPTRALGVSAGAVSAAVLLTGACPREFARLLGELAADARGRRTGLFGVWGRLLRAALEEGLPQGPPPPGLRVWYSHLTPTGLRGRASDPFADRAAMIEGVLTSCHVPFFMDLRPWRSFEGRLALDGGLTAPAGLRDGRLVFDTATPDAGYLDFLRLPGPEAAAERFERGYAEFCDRD